MRKYLPKAAMVAGALLVVGLITYALGRIWYVHSAGLPFTFVKSETTRVTLICLIVVPFGLLMVAGGWIWKRMDDEVEQENLLARQRKPKRVERANKFTR
jgi:hypothetical protein